MRKLIQKNDTRANIRWQLLTGVSALALTAYVSSAGMVLAEDSNQPQVWVELGGQLSRLEAGQEAFAPPFTAARPSIFTPSQKFERMPLYSIDEDGSISFRPEGSDWIFSASISYGRSASKRHVHQQTTPPVFVTYAGTTHNRYAKYAAAAKFADTRAQNSERHLVLDFEAGKDVGLGMFGVQGSSTLNLGVRFAQFGSKSNIALKSAPDWHFYSKYFSYLGKTIPFGSAYHANAAQLRAERSFHGVGPSISWNASASIAGNPQNSELTLDWGINAALLFGRQRAKVQHQTTAQYHGHKYNHYSLRKTLYQTSKNPPARVRSATVPDIGGFAGLSFRYGDAKVSFGYRGDFFFGAIDGGIDTRKSENRAFFGPYASVSVGVGD